MYQAMSSRGYYHGRSCPICTRCFHRCSARIPAIPSSVVSRHGSRSDRPSKKPTVFRWGPPPPRSNRPSQPHFFLRLGSVGWGGIRWGVPDRTNRRDFGGVRLPRPGYPTGYRDPSLVESICNPKGRNQEFKVINLKNLVAIAAKS